MPKLKLDCFLPITCTSGTNNVRKQRFSELFEEAYDGPKKLKDTDILEIKIVFYFIGKCRADVDNLLKNLFDALEDCGVYYNDSQIKKVTASIEDENLLEGIAIKIWKR